MVKETHEEENKIQTSKDNNPQEVHSKEDDTKAARTEGSVPRSK